MRLAGTPYSTRLPASQLVCSSTLKRKLLGIPRGKGSHKKALIQNDLFQGHCPAPTLSKGKKLAAVKMLNACGAVLMRIDTMLLLVVAMFVKLPGV